MQQKARQLTAHLFADKGAMAMAVAAAVADDISHYASGNAATITIALAGGGTPKPAYRALSKMKLPWHRLEFIATDERITNDKSRSNEKMIADALGAKARIIKLREGAPAPSLDIALLGMGADGHTASLFADAMPDDNETRICKVAPATMPEERLTLPMATLAAAARLLIVITGEAKWQILARPPSPALPITTLITTRQTITDTPAEVFHAPD